MIDIWIILTVLLLGGTYGYAIGHEQGEHRSRRREAPQAKVISMADYREARRAARRRRS